MNVHKAYYEIVRDVLALNIGEGALPQGTRLYVAAVADRLSVSRSPVKRALELLSDEGVVTRDGARGYVVGRTVVHDTTRPNLHLLDLHLPGNETAALVPPSWEMIVQKVDQEMMNAIPFGIYQISESGICDHFKVSRTVTREVLARLHDRGTISKDRASHWIAGPLSARMLDDLHDIRQIVEPAALDRAAPALDLGMVAAMRGRAASALSAEQTLTEDMLDRLETDLHVTCLSPLRNLRLAQVVRNAQLSFVVNRLFATYIARHDETAMLLEHRLVLDHLAIRDGTGAAMALRHHLDADHIRTRDRLKVLAVFGDPSIAPYLTRLV